MPVYPDSSPDRTVSQRLRFLILLVMIVVLFGLSSCGFISANDSPITVVTYQPSGPGGDAALLEGVLATRSGCLVVEQDNGIVVPFFPKSKVRYTSDGGVRLFGTNYGLGDTASFGGGYHSDPFDVVIPEACKQIVATSDLFTAWC